MDKIEKRSLLDLLARVKLMRTTNSTHVAWFEANVAPVILEYVRANKRNGWLWSRAALAPKWLWVYHDYVNRLASPQYEGEANDKRSTETPSDSGNAG